MKTKKLLLLIPVSLFFSARLFSQAPTATCATATVLTVNGACGSGTLTTNTLEAGVSSTNICGSGQAINSREGWYSFVASVPNVTITGDASNRNLTLQVFSGTCGSLTEIGCANTTTTSGAQTETVNLSGLTVGQTYYVRVGNITSNDMTLTSLCIVGNSAPSNDDPCSATAIPVSASCTYATYTNAAATATSGVPAPGCSSYLGGDVWFTVTVPASGSLTIDTQTGVVTDGGMAVYSGTCSSLTLVSCDDDASANGAMPMISLSGQTPGATLYVRFWEYGNNNNGTFGICATAVTLNVPQNCQGAIPVCNDASFAGNASGFGQQELNASNTGCLLSYEHQSTWFGFSPSLPGTIALGITPTAGAIDYDFAIWGPYPPGTGCPVTGTPLRCSYASGATTNSATGSYVTGLGGPGTETSDGTGGTLDGWVTPITITAAQVGMVYYLVVDNFTANSTPFTLNWTLSPNNMLNCTPPLPAEMGIFNAENSGAANHIYWTTLTEINCSYFIVEKSQDGISYTKMGRINGNGNSNTAISYDAFDNSPFETTYYRLKQYDYNGAEKSYGPIVLTNNEAYGLRLDKIYPNPADESFTVELYSKNYQAAELNIQVFDAVGKLMYQQVITEEGKLNVQINSSNWAAGLYTIKITSDDFNLSETRKIIIQ